MRLKTCLAGLLCLGFLAFTGCAKPLPPDLEKGMTRVRYITSPKALKKSMFYAVYPQGRPSEFIGYMYSDLGAIDFSGPGNVAPIPGMPANGPSPYDEQTRDAAPALPPNVMILPLKTDPSRSQPQIVLKPDDAARQIIVEVYELPSQPPIKVEKRDLPLMTADPMAQSSAKSLMEQGATAGAR